MKQLKQIDKILSTTTKAVDDSFESEEERQATLTERLRLDMMSDSKLAKMVRPIIALTLLGLEIIVVLAILWGVVVPEHIVYELGGLLFSAIGFYFNSRRNEKINEKKIEAAIKIEKIKAEAAIDKEKILLKEEVKDNKVERKANKKPFFGKRKNK